MSNHFPSKYALVCKFEDKWVCCECQFKVLFASKYRHLLVNMLKTKQVKSDTLCQSCKLPVGRESCLGAAESIVKMLENTNE